MAELHPLLTYKGKFLSIRDIAIHEYTKALRAIGRGHQRAVRDEMRKEDVFASGKTYAQVEPQPVTLLGDRLSVEVGVYGDRDRVTVFIEEGRSEGKQPPVEEIKDWMQSRRIAQGESEEDRTAIAYAIADSIGEFGVDERPVFAQAVKKYDRRAEKIIKAATKRIIKRINGASDGGGDGDSD